MGKQKLETGRTLRASRALAEGDSKAFDEIVASYPKTGGQRAAPDELKAARRELLKLGRELKRAENRANSYRRMAESWRQSAQAWRVGGELLALTNAARPGGAVDVWLGLWRAAGQSTDGRVRAAVDRVINFFRAGWPEVAEKMAEALGKPPEAVRPPGAKSDPQSATVVTLNP